MEGRAPPEKMMDALTMRARARNLGARGVGGCSVQLAHHQCRGSPSPLPLTPDAPLQPPFPVKIFSRKSAKNGSLLLTCSHTSNTSSAGCCHSYLCLVDACSMYGNSESGPGGPLPRVTCHGNPASSRLVLAELQPVGPNNFEASETEPRHPF